MQDGRITISFGSAQLILTALLCILKLTEILSISWWWCFCLIWLPFALFFGVCLLLIVCAFIYAIGAVIIDLLKNKR